MEEKKFGTENLEIVTDLILEAVNVGDSIFSKGEKNYMELFRLMDEVLALQNCSFSLIDDEIKDLDSEERLAMEAKIKAKFDIHDDALEGVIEKAFALIKKGAEFGLEIRDFIVEIKALVEAKKEADAASEAPAEA